jgi:heme O synthase-like polyprenyltransferase
MLFEQAQFAKFIRKVAKLKYLVIALIYLYVVFMAWSAFGWMGITYAVVVPIPLVFLSWMVRRSQKNNTGKMKPTLNIWTSPIPYLSFIFIFIILHTIFS